MHARKFTAVIAAAVATATLALATAPSEAQTTAARKRQDPTQVAMTGRPPAKVTVRRRSYLDPGTETKTLDQHYHDYAFPPSGNSYGADPNDFRINFNRMPFPSCFDMAGFCR